MYRDFIRFATAAFDYSRSSLERFQAWVRPLVDADDEQFGGWIDAARTTAGAPGRVWAGVGAYRNPVERTVRQIDLARAIGVGGIAVFAYHRASATAPPAGSTPSLERIGDAAFR